MAWDDVVVRDGLNDAERMAWMEEAKRKGKPAVYGRLMFIGDNAERLADGMDIRRMP
jgi:hypothetical protein